MEVGWPNKILHRPGFSLAGWLANLLETVIVIIVVIILISTAWSCIKRLIICMTMGNYILLPKRNSETD